MEKLKFQSIGEYDESLNRSVAQLKKEMGQQEVKIDSLKKDLSVNEGKPGKVRDYQHIKSLLVCIDKHRGLLSFRVKMLQSPFARSLEKSTLLLELSGKISLKLR